MYSILEVYSVLEYSVLEVLLYTSKTVKVLRNYIKAIGMQNIDF